MTIELLDSAAARSPAMMQSLSLWITERKRRSCFATSAATSPTAARTVHVCQSAVSPQSSEATPKRPPSRSVNRPPASAAQTMASRSLHTPLANRELLSPEE
jgi:hypothetical protein